MTIKLYFYSKDLLKKNKDASGSAVMRSNQIYYNIKKRFKFIDCTMTINYENIKNSAILFVKDNFNLNLNILKTVKCNNNIVIFDVLDYYDINTNDIPDMFKNNFIKYIDILIVNNNFMRKKYYQLNKPIYVIPHHFDFRLLNYKNIPKMNKFQLIYNGELGLTNQNCLYIQNLKEKYNLIHSQNFNEYLKNYLKSNYCFISIRQENTYEFNNRPLMKLAHAAAVNSNIIITKDKSVIDFIDPDYPYLLKNSDYETVIKMIEYANKTFNTNIWKKGLQMMNELKIRLNINHIISYDYMKIFHYLEKPIKSNIGYKICFVTSYFGTYDYFELSNNFPKVEYADYYCFTNLDKNKLGINIWKIIEIESDFLNTKKNKNIMLNRYFKFMVWKYLKEKMNKNYDFIFYCDHYLNPNSDINWMKICDRLNNSKLGFIQYEHKRFLDGIKKDLECIILNGTEDKKNILEAEEYLQNIDNNIDLNTPQYFENTVFGMQVNIKIVKRFTQFFWYHYYSNNYPSYRDQPLWNYLYLKRNIYPYVDNELRSYFNGFKTIWRSKENY